MLQGQVQQSCILFVLQGLVKQHVAPSALHLYSCGLVVDCTIWGLQVKTDYQRAVKEGIVDLGFQNPSKAAQLVAHHIDQVKVVHPIPEQGCINLDKACKRQGQVVSGEKVHQCVT